MMLSTELERERRWRLVLGKTDEEENGQGGQSQEAASGDSEAMPSGDHSESQSALSEEDSAIDETLDQLYGEGERGGDADSSPDIARWLGNINKYFPSSVAQIVQQDALDKWKLKSLIHEPEFLESLEPNVSLVSQLINLSKLMPDETKESAREVVRKVVEDLKEKLEYRFLQALTGSLNRSIRVRKPRKHREINWFSTIKSNLKHYQPEYQTVVPEILIGHGKQKHALHDVILCIDQSGSMAESVVYASIFGSVMASVPALKTKLVVFDTNVVDLSENLSDPVDLLFGLRLKGGTNIDKAVAYCESLIERPRDTVLILISDLFEGTGKKENLINRLSRLSQSEVKLVSLLALSDQGTPKYNKDMAQQLSEFGVPSFACTPDLFPDLMEVVLSDRNLKDWAVNHPHLVTG
ncbi:MAG: VWA domain-containing protein [Trueperaceae bacterium]|nr:VWA domain-containing protein [Trueperaceae bacterium]